MRVENCPFLAGVLDSMPLVIAAVPFGFVYGALAAAGGMSESFAVLMSLLVFAGSSQFIAVSLLTAAVAGPVIVFTVFVVNLRHLLYSATLMERMQRYPLWVRTPLAFWLTDETFAVVHNKLQSEPKDADFAWYFLGSGLAMYVNWALCSWLGYVLGAGIPDIQSWGLEVAMVVAFIGVVVPSLQKPVHWLCAITAGVGAVLTRDFPHQTGLLFSALVAIALALCLDKESPEIEASENE